MTPPSDPVLPLTSRAGNIILLQFLGGLKPTEDVLVEELVTKTLRASPDILGRFFKESRYSFAPRVQSAWRDNVQLVKKVRNHRLVSRSCGVKWHCFIRANGFLFQRFWLKWDKWQ